MGSLNKAMLIGNLGRDMEMSSTSTGFQIGRASIATTHRRKDSRTGQYEDKTEWHRIVLLGKTAESLEPYMKKGKQIYVEGRIETRSWDDKDGQKRYMTEIIVDRVQLLGSRGSDGGGDYGGGGGRSRRSQPQQQSQSYDDGQSQDYGGGDIAPEESQQWPGVGDDDVPF